MVIAAGMVFNIGLGTVADLYGKDPAQAATVWLAIESVFDGLEGGNVIFGNLWTLLVSWAAWQGGGLPKALNYLTSTQTVTIDNWREAKSRDQKVK